jgi:hypothetical protein
VVSFFFVTFKDEWFNHPSLIIRNMKKVFYFLGALFAFSLLSGESLAQEYRMTRSFALYPLPRLTAAAPTYPKAGSILTIKGDKEGEFFKVTYLDNLLYMHESSMPYCTLNDSTVHEKGKKPIESLQENQLRKDLALAGASTWIGASFTIFGGVYLAAAAYGYQSPNSLNQRFEQAFCYILGVGGAIIGLPLLINGVVQTGRYRTLLDSTVYEKGEKPIDYLQENQLRKDLARAKTITWIGAGMTIFGGGVCLWSVANFLTAHYIEAAFAYGKFFPIGAGTAIIGLTLLNSGVVQTGKYRSKMLQLNPNFSLSPLVIQGPDRHSMGVLLGVRFSL